MVEGGGTRARAPLRGAGARERKAAARRRPSLGRALSHTHTHTHTHKDTRARVLLLLDNALLSLAPHARTHAHPAIAARARKIADSLETTPSFSRPATTTTMAVTDVTTGEAFDRELAQNELVRHALCRD